MEHQVTINDDVICYDVIRRSVKNPRLEFREGRLKIILPKNYAGHESIIHRHRRWIYNRHCRARDMLTLAEGAEIVTDRKEEEFRSLVTRMTDAISEELGVAPKAVRFRKMKTKWGSCSSKGNLCFNTHIRYLPENLMEYIVFHEMVHLIELNHGPAFQSRIRMRFSDHKDCDRKLSAYWLLIQQHVNSISPCAAR